MKISISSFGDFKIINFEEELNVISDLEELAFLVDGYHKRGKLKIAVKFPNVSYIYSGAIAVLLRCIKTMKDGQGILCIIEDNKDIRTVFETLGISKIIPVVRCEDDLLKISLEKSGV